MKKPVRPKTELDLVNRSAELIALIRKECLTWIYDRKKVEAKLNCNYLQARTLITLAQLEDGR